MNGILLKINFYYRTPYKLFSARKEILIVWFAYNLSVTISYKYKDNILIILITIDNIDYNWSIIDYNKLFIKLYTLIIKRVLYVVDKSLRLKSD